MNRRPPSVEDRRPPSVSSVSLMRAAENWLAAGRAQGWSKRTLGDHRKNLERFCWWLTNESEMPSTLDQLSAFMVRSFLGYLQDPHPTGRFGCTRDPGARRGARPSTVHAYYRDLHSFARFCVEEGLFDADPLLRVKAPKIPKDEIQPMSNEQVQQLLNAARSGRTPERDGALILLLVDSGLRVSEVCSLTLGAVDRVTGEIVVRSGKGGKHRKSFLGATARRKVWGYIERKRLEAKASDPLFISAGGHTPNSAMTRSGIGEIIRNLGRAAGISGVRCSPHTLRHTFAVNYLRGGGNVLELQRLLGHEDLEMTRRYVALAGADLADAHRAASPADRMKLK